MNALDFVIAGIAVPAAIGGWRLGLLTRAASWLGLGVGLAAGARLAPFLVGRFSGLSSSYVLPVAAAILLACGLAGQLLGTVAGGRLRVNVPTGRKQTIDRALGSGTGLVGVALAAWLLLPVMQNLPRWPARQASGSVLGRFVLSTFGEPPDTLRQLTALVGHDRWGSLLEDLGKGLHPVEPTVTDFEPSVLALAEASTVKIKGDCASSSSVGSGFVVGNNLIMTNAHVVAGVRQPRVIGADGASVRGRVIVFDTRRDLAVLRTEGVSASALRIGTGSQGTTGMVLGHPGGNELKARPFIIERQDEAKVDFLYWRKVFLVGAHLEKGDSGAPLIDRTGAVIGVNFAVSTNEQFLAIALTSDEISPVLKKAEELVATHADSVVGTGSCLTDI